MASNGNVPPRLSLHRSHSKDATKETHKKSSVDILVQMGFAKHRAEKAIASTGDRGVQLATDWLLSHVNDPLIDKQIPRDYIIYLCPVGCLQNELNKFWEKSLQSCRWNGAHAYFPHITLCPFFEVNDNQVNVLEKSFESIKECLNKAPGKLSLEYFSKKGFIGLFVDKVYYKYLEDLIDDYSKEVKKSGINIESRKKQLHLSLAYQHQEADHNKLQELSKEINLNADVRWDIRVYSRDKRAAKSEVRKVIKSYAPQLHDELELIDGDYIFLDPKEVLESVDGWYSGTSWVTGNAGTFPGNFTQRTAETWTWTLHRSLPLVESKVTDVPMECSNSNVREEDPVYSKINKVHKNSIERRPKLERPISKCPRQLYVMRHGERCDFALGKEWLHSCFKESGEYTRNNLNLPRKMPQRSNYLDFVRDSPLTEIGLTQARLTGEAMKDAGITIDHVFCSPSLRCVQTAHEVTRQLGINCKFCIDPGVFEWLGWYTLAMPNFLTAEQFSEMGYPIDTSYTPFMTVAKLKNFEDETILNYFSRCSGFTKYVLKLKGKENGNILIAAHAASLAACTHEIRGQKLNLDSAFNRLVGSIGYCAICMCEEDSKTGKWTLKDSKVPPLIHSNNKKEDLMNVLL